MKNIPSMAGCSMPAKKLSRLFVAICATTCFTPLHALEYTWLGGVGDWDLSLNWNLPSVPGANDKAILKSGLAKVMNARQIGALMVGGGGIGGPANLTVTGLTEYTSGSIGGFGGDVVANGGLAVSGANNKTLGANAGNLSSGLVNNGQGSWTGTGNFDNWASGRFVNGSTGSFDIQTDADFSGGSFINQGSLTKSLGAGGAAKTQVRALFHNTGSVHVQQGVLEVSTAFDNLGSITVSAGATFHGNDGNFANSGLIKGNGMVKTEFANDLLNKGVIAPGESTGSLTIDGDLTMAASGKLQFELSSTLDFDRLTITDDAQFAGNLEIMNLGYTPVIGDSFTIITFDQRLALSTFSSLTVTGFGAGVNFSVTYNPHDVTLNVISVPEPSSYGLMAVGLLMLGACLRQRRKP